MKKKLKAIWKIIRSDSFFIGTEKARHLFIDSTMTKPQVEKMVDGIRFELKRRYIK